MTYDLKRRLMLGATAVAFSLLPISVYAADRFVIKAADPSEHGDGTMSAAASAAMNRGALPKSAAEVGAKAAATAASVQALGQASAAPAGTAAGPLATVSGGDNFQGQFNAGSTPPDTTGAIGTTRYVQLVNTHFGIYNRATNALISSGTLNQLADLASSVNTFDPQIIWDPDTNRFYYVNDSIFSATDNRLSFGFSKTATPNNGTTDWCHYTFPYGSEFPDYPKLGDSAFFTIIGVNTFAGNSFVGSDLIAISKPPAGVGCPAVGTFKTGVKFSLVDTPSGNQVFTPVPANQIDPSAIGYVVARNGGLPSNKLWFFTVTRNATTGNPVFGNAKGVTVVNYAFPPNAPAGATGSRLLDTLDARPTQAVQAINPNRNPDTFSFWVQHTIAFGAVSAVRWYEINPVPAVPVLLRQGNMIRSPAFAFNGAISPDRRVRTGVARAFGDSAVINYSVTKRGPAGINPRIEGISSFSGAPFGGIVILQSSPAAYVDFSCAGLTATCRWGDYAGANPDPFPPADNRGVVWGTNQWGSGVQNAAQANWRTKIFALRP